MHRLLVVAAVLLLHHAGAALACECLVVGPGSRVGPAPEWPFVAHDTDLDLPVLRGVVTSIREVSWKDGDVWDAAIEVRFRVTKSWGSNVGTEFTLHQLNGGCSFFFEEGLDYLVFADGGDNGPPGPPSYEASICGWTNFAEGNEDLMRQLDSLVARRAEKAP